jgi:hypothetical protein
MSIELT